MSRISPHVQERSAFTLVEMLVSITVLSMMLLTLAQAIGLVSQIWSEGIGAVDNFSKARQIMDLLDRDAKSMVFRPDTTAFVDSTGTFSCAFYANIEGSPGTDARTVSLVQYALNPLNGSDPTSQMTLGRLNYGMNYVATTGGITPYVNATMPASPTMSQLPSATAVNTDTVASGIIQFQCQFIDGGGNLITPTSTTPFSYNFNTPSIASNPRVLIVSLLVLNDTASRLVSQNAAILTKLRSDFNTTLPAGPSGTPIITYSQSWNNTLNPTSGVLDTSLPPAIRSSLKVYSRSITLPVAAP